MTGTDLLTRRIGCILACPWRPVTPWSCLGAAWGEFQAWIVANGHTTGPDFWECYVAGPESNPDPATWRTELNRPVIG